MSYTCDDCCLQCIERSRMYICTSFKLGKLSAGDIKARKQQGSKSNRAKSNAPENGVQCARKGKDK